MSSASRAATLTRYIGHHHFVYAIGGHKQDWREGQIPIRAARLNQPLTAFQTKAHIGSLGKSFSMLRANTDQVAMRAFKNAEEADEIAGPASRPVRILNRSDAKQS